MPKLLELFCGPNHSVGKVFEAAGWEVVSVDIEAKYEPTLCMSVLDIELDRWEPGTFDCVWSSPPCTLFSKARTTGEKVDMEPARLLTLHTVNLIRALSPKYWCIENPATSSIWSLPCLSGLPYVVASYCRYGFLYRKNTRIATNVSSQLWRIKFCTYNCQSLIPGKKKHIATAQRGKSHAEDRTWKQSDLYKIPAPLIEDLVTAITEAEES